MIHDTDMIQASRDAFAPLVEAEAYAADLDRAERFTTRLAAVAIALVFAALVFPMIVRGVA